MAGLQHPQRAVRLGEHHARKDHPDVAAARFDGGRTRIVPYGLALVLPSSRGDQIGVGGKRIAKRHIEVDRLDVESPIPERSVTTVGAASPSISGRATPASTGVTSPIHNEESHGVISGTGIRGRRGNRAPPPCGRASRRR